MDKHTPGPWAAEWDERSVPGAFSINAFRNGRTVYVAETYGGLDEEEANARLIAAAPELLTALETLEALVNTIDHSIGFCCCGDPVDAHSIDSGHSPVDAGDYHAHNAIEMARAAIAKARGETK